MLKFLLKTFEKPTCFSKSMLWSLITKHYQDSGHKAWERNVPYIVTNSVLAAESHAAQIIQHYLETPNPSQYLIIDYGAGIGQHAYYLAKALTELASAHQLPLKQFKIIMADISPDCIDFWNTNPSLTPYIKSGLIVTHRLTGEWVRDLSNLCNQPHSHACLIANYLLDSMPFEAYEHHILQGLSLSAPRSSLSPNFSGPLSAITLKSTPLISQNHPLKEAYNNTYRYTIPATAIQFLSAFFNSAHNGMVIINDKSYPTTESISYDEVFNLNYEGSYSSTVNIDAIKRSLPNLHWHETTYCKTIQSYTLRSNHFKYTSQNNCADAANLFNHFKQLEKIPAALCGSIAKTLAYDPFCLELFSQSIVPDCTDLTHITEIIEACLNNHFHKPLDYILLHIAKIYRRLSSYDRCEYFLKRHTKQYKIDGAYWLELGLLKLSTKNINEAINALKQATQDTITKDAASKVLNDIHEMSDNEN